MFKKYEDLGNQITLLHVSTDEVYGSLKIDEDNFDEATLTNLTVLIQLQRQIDHLQELGIRLWIKTFITNCSNNYGPMQHNEKLIPKVISNVQTESIFQFMVKAIISEIGFMLDHCKAILCP